MLTQNFLLHLTAFWMLNLNDLLSLLNDLNVVVASVSSALLLLSKRFDISSWHVLVHDELLVLRLLVGCYDLFHLRLASKLLGMLNNNRLSLLNIHRQLIDRTKLLWNALADVGGQTASRKLLLLLRRIVAHHLVVLELLELLLCHQLLLVLSRLLELLRNHLNLLVSCVCFDLLQRDLSLHLNLIALWQLVGVHLVSNDLLIIALTAVH